MARTKGPVFRGGDRKDDPTPPIRARAKPLLFDGLSPIDIAHLMALMVDYKDRKVIESVSDASNIQRQKPMLLGDEEDTSLAGSLRKSATPETGLAIPTRSNKQKRGRSTKKVAYLAVSPRPTALDQEAVEQDMLAIGMITPIINSAATHTLTSADQSASTVTLATSASENDGIPEGAVDMNRAFRKGKSVPLGVKLPLDDTMTTFEWIAYTRNSSFDWNDQKHIHSANRWRARKIRQRLDKFGMKVDRRLQDAVAKVEDDDDEVVHNLGRIGKKKPEEQNDNETEQDGEAVEEDQEQGDGESAKAGEKVGHVRGGKISKHMPEPCKMS